MSQRLYIGSPIGIDWEIYDCVIFDDFLIRQKIERDWLCRQDSYYVGPWKVRIENVKLWAKVEPVIDDVFTEIGEDYPSCVWCFYHKNSNIEHPSRQELDVWMSEVCK